MKVAGKMRSRAVMFATVGGLGLSGLVPVAAQESAQESAPEQTLEQPQGQEQPTTLEAVTVSAQRREEELKDVPISILNFSAETLENAHVTRLSDLDKLTSGFRVDKRTNFVVPTIRGVTTQLFLAGAGTNVGVYVDGFYSPALQASDFDLMNIESIQILKGPQGTLFGRNTTAGAVLVNTFDPSFTPQATVEAGLGSYNSQRYQVYGTTGLGDKVAVDVSGMYSKGDGWTTNLANGDDKVGSYENSSFRFGILADITDNFSILGRYNRSSVTDPTNLLQVPYMLDGRPAASAAFRPGAIVATRRGEVSADEDFSNYKFRTDSYQLTASLDLGWADFTSYTQYREDRQLEQVQSLDFTNLPVMHLDIPDYNDTFTQEFLLTSKPGGRLQYTTGLFYFDSDQSFPYVRLSVNGSPLAFTSASGVNNQSTAAFGDVTYEASDGLFLTGGLRYTRDDAKSAFYSVGGTTTYLPTLSTDRVTPRVVVRYEMNDASSVYASYSQGYKSALYNVGGFSPVPIDPEELNSFEVGFKYSRAALTANVAAYYYDYKNQQVVSNVLVNGVPASRIANAASSKMHGIEGDFQYRFSQSFSIFGGAAWSNARYDDFTNASFFTWTPANTFPQAPGDASGNHMPRAPDFTANLSGTYETSLASGKLVLSGNVYYSSDFYFDPANQLPEDSYTTVGLRAAWTDPTDRYTLALSGRNVTDTHYRSQGHPNALGISAIWAPPALYEASVRVKF